MIDLKLQDQNKSKQYERKVGKDIFTTPLGKINSDVPETNEAKKKNHRLGAVYMGVAALILIVYSFFFFYPQMLAYVGFDKKISSINKEANNYKTTLSDLEKKRDSHKAAYDKEFQDEQRILNTVFPKTTEKLEVIRLMENFATHLNSTYPPFEFTSISFQESKKENGYTVLPFQTSIHSSQKNFERFLELINLSGVTDPKMSEHIRLMEITNTSLTYRGVDKTGKDQGVDFNVQLNAYSQ